MVTGLKALHQACRRGKGSASLGVRRKSETAGRGVEGLAIRWAGRFLPEGALPGVNRVRTGNTWGGLKGKYVILLRNIASNTGPNAAVQTRLN
jgi:hypothetical protein